MPYEAVIGLEAHIEMQTQSKMFCACPVVDSVSAPPNSAVCPICAGHPGTLPVLNEKAVEYALRVALALECTVNPTSIFARKNYFYPDIPKGFQISQYEQPLAEYGRIVLQTSQGQKIIRIRRVHLEEDTGKLTHVESAGAAPACSLVDLNRAGVPLLEIVTEPDFRSAEEVRVYGLALRALVRALGINSGDMEKGVMRIEPNISIRPLGQSELGTKVEIKNLNSFRALERGVAYEIARHEQVLTRGGKIAQETVGWDEAAQATYSQRSKEDAHDYRYFPEPDLPALRVSAEWIARVRAALPELPIARATRYQRDFGLSLAESTFLAQEAALGGYFERVTAAGPIAARSAFAWVTGELLGLVNASGTGFDSIKVDPQDLAALLKMVAEREINQATAKTVLAGMFASGRKAPEIVAANGLAQVSDGDLIAQLVAETLAENPGEVASYRAGKLTVANFLFGQVMRKAGGQANPQVVRAVLEKQLVL
ncbi:MAG: Asp-tRNA(Asn)/Glu-tRNA(Gln) amidotransferase subunit GatB [Anaerolineales bacterium]|jgi:aspartyl-tRNA(Asn)/glutamyl-tRNA(Gln) amidotransferase subunit B|nr:Asp-tRNA(Asn)/Glu-tRNA(Gln) amidotransferase subunit GatB [Anaerolineales bacterium]